MIFLVGLSYLLQPILYLDLHFQNAAVGILCRDE